jgi:hypothetical protein
MAGASVGPFVCLVDTLRPTPTNTNRSCRVNTRCGCNFTSCPAPLMCCFYSNLALFQKSNYRSNPKAIKLARNAETRTLRAWESIAICYIENGWVNWCRFSCSFFIRYHKTSLTINSQLVKFDCQFWQFSTILTVTVQVQRGWQITLIGLSPQKKILHNCNIVNCKSQVLTYGFSISISS